jgi:hypothetical protein
LGGGRIREKTGKNEGKQGEKGIQTGRGNKGINRIFTPAIRKIHFKRQIHDTYTIYPTHIINDNLVWWRKWLPHPFPRLPPCISTNS